MGLSLQQGPLSPAAIVVGSLPTKLIPIAAFPRDATVIAEVRLLSGGISVLSEVAPTRSPRATAGKRPYTATPP